MGETVSCLCVSRPRRYGQLQRAILDFLAQTYADRELVIVVDQQGDYASAVQAFVDQQMLPDDGPKVTVLARTAKSQLEGLMYAAIHARGQILCLWDDDNTNHPDRLKHQIEVQQKFKTAVTVYSQGFYHFHKDDELFMVNVDKPDAVAALRTLPSTMMAYREFFPVMEPSARAKPSEQLLNAAAKQGRKIVPIKASLHVVGVTSDNLRGYEFHRRVAQEQGLTAEALNGGNVKPLLDQFSWDKPLSVEGVDGGAFEYTPVKTWPADLYAIKVDPDPEPEPKPTPAKEPAPATPDKK